MGRRDTRRPNILLLMADQHRADAIAQARRDGGERETTLQTPHLDRLCKEGTRFARAYTESPVCVSARATILTGLLPHQTGVFDNGYKVGPEAMTLPKQLRDRGYHCQAIGKMHFWPVREHHGHHRMWLSEEIPRTPDEDEFLAELIAAGWGHVEEPHGIRHELYYVPQVSQLPEERHTTSWTGRKTVEYLEEHVRERRDEPFFCWTSFIKPHPPFDPPVPWHTLYKPTDLPLGTAIRTEDEAERHTYYHRTQNRFKWTDAQPDNNMLRMMRAYYAGAVSFIDYWVGQILDTLGRLEMRENTLVLYVADHGEYLGDHYAYGKRGYHDPAARVPFIVSWPGTLPQGKVSQALVGLADVLPACVAAADGKEEAALPAGREVWVGQLAEKGKGLYAAIDAEWKYVYSAADRREYLMYHGTGEGPACDRSECQDHAADGAKRATLERLRGALQERFRADGYVDPLDPAEANGWRLYEQPKLAWEALDEMEDRSTVGRGWQYARWKRGDARFDGRLDGSKAVYRFSGDAALPRTP